MRLLQQSLKKILFNQRWRFVWLVILILLSVFIDLSTGERPDKTVNQNKIIATSSTLSVVLPLVPRADEQRTLTPAKNNLADTKKTAVSLNQNSATATAKTYYPVTGVVDGDTIDVNINGRISRIRLIGINTPEAVDPRQPVQCFGQEASEEGKRLLTGQRVSLAADNSQDDEDKYGRLLRYVWRADGLFYNLEMIKRGLAFEYTYFLPYQYQTEFKAAQDYAKNNKIGLWADNTCSGHLIPAAKTGEQTLIRLPAQTNLKTSTSSNGCLIKGNINSKGEKIFHLPNCPYYNQTVIEESKGEKWFCTAAEAIAAGWRQAQNCP